MLFKIHAYVGDVEAPTWEEAAKVAEKKLATMEEFHWANMVSSEHFSLEAVNLKNSASEN